MVYQEKLQKAYEEWRARKDRERHPDGHFDNGGRWYPSDQEEQECCKQIRWPSRRWPYSLLKHCRSIEHVATLYGVSPADLRAYACKVEGWTDRARLTPTEAYKMVGVTEDGRLVSIFDAETEYRLGETLRQRVRRNHGGGFYAYLTFIAAQGASFPDTAEGLHLPRAIIKVRAAGQWTSYFAGRCNHYSDRRCEWCKYAFSSITPVEIVWADPEAARRLRGAGVPATLIEEGGDSGR